MPAKPTERQYRAMAAPLESAAGGDDRRFPHSDYEVRGYATTFDDPYVLFVEGDGTEYREAISPDAFADADMRDVIMQYDHRGHVYARMSNGTLVVEPDEHGLLIAADLGGSQRGRDLHEEIKNGLTTRMSWAFTVSEDKYDRESRTCTITRVKKVYDVSAVSLPADPNTEISARSMLRGETERRRGEPARRKRALAVARAQLEISEMDTLNRRD